MTELEINKIQKDLKAAYSEIEKKHGISISTGNVSYDDDSYHTTMEVIAVGDTHSKKDVEKALYKRNLSKIQGMELQHYGRTFVYRGKTYTIKGIDPVKTKYQVVCMRSDGEILGFPVKVVEAALTTVTPVV